MRRSPSRSIARRRPLVSLLLCLALLWAQGLGLVHRIGHAPHGLPVAPGSPVEQPAPKPGTAAWQSLADALTGHDHDGAECRLYDQASVADVLVPASLAATGELPSSAVPPAGEMAPAVARDGHALPRGPPPRA